MAELDNEWAKFLLSMNNSNIVCNDSDRQIIEPVKQKAIINSNTMEVPKCKDLYISTQTKQIRLNQSNIDVSKIFWEIPIVDYWKPTEGIIKKQMKVACFSKDECEETTRRLQKYTYFNEKVMKQTDNPNSTKHKFKRESKVTVGISTKNVMNCRGKEKGGAMFNCFAITIRFRNESGRFQEIHVKVFNTGKLEIPGINNQALLVRVSEYLIDVLTPFFETPIEFLENTSENDNVLINSNFHCGFNINREKLHSIIKRKYKIDTLYDSCKYPGINCKFYFNREKGFNIETQNGVIQQEDHRLKMDELQETDKYIKVTFVIFQTGSCIIVGNCNEKVLRFVYEFVKKMLHDEYYNIFIDGETITQKIPSPIEDVEGEEVISIDKSKSRKRRITVTTGYFSQLKNISL
jgi:TATA-box binding protein (TBP) (component of TFIID and TFIIIB)